MMKIILTGGGSGGHTMPLIAVYDGLLLLSNITGVPLKIVFMGPKSKIPLTNTLKQITIPSGKLRRYFSLYNILDIPKIIFGIKLAFFYMLAKRPDIIFSKGGYGSVPVVIAGWLLGIPIILHESDSVAGMANKIVARFAKEILVSFPGSLTGFPKNKCTLVGNPIRDMRGASKQEAIKALRLNGGRPVILILGGSQGALQINALITAILDILVQKYEIIHQTGPKNITAVRHQTNYHAWGFLDKEQIKYAYTAADIVISRAGSGAIFEIASLGKPSILIPLKSSAAGHQEKNALLYRKTGAALVLPNPSPVELLEAIQSVLDDEDKRQKMAKAALDFARPDAASRIAKIILNYGH